MSAEFLLAVFDAAVIIGFTRLVSWSVRRAHASRAVCHGIIPGTFIACGEGGNYCSDECWKAAKS